MEFEWDENKDQMNIKRHGFGFERAKTIFDYEILTREDDRKDYGEIREISLGLLEGKTIITAVHTKRKGKIRIISARKANKEEREAYNEFTGKNS